jgi:hypothetical protein
VKTKKASKSKMGHLGSWSIKKDKKNLRDCSIKNQKELFTKNVYM